VPSVPPKCERLLPDPPRRIIHGSTRVWRGNGRPIVVGCFPSFSPCRPHLWVSSTRARTDSIAGDERRWPPDHGHGAGQRTIKVATETLISRCLMEQLSLVAIANRTKGGSLASSPTLRIATLLALPHPAGHFLHRFIVFSRRQSVVAEGIRPTAGARLLRRSKKTPPARRVATTKRVVRRLNKAPRRE